ncbi:MAG: hypothetical protein JSW05_11480 [Candidatus Thorarchaeota archaeon]|nr:MAG: hypothetical protein JSW05_11480 [Candidatus Thorarchaeota archaeon]
MPTESTIWASLIARGISRNSESTPQMTQDCNDDFCKEKIRAVDQALGREEEQWHTLLYLTKDHEDLRNALRFCEVFQLEAKVKVTNDGYSVLVRNREIQTL